MLTIESAASVSNPKVTLTCLFKYSGEGDGPAHNGIQRYKGENGKLTVYETFAASENLTLRTAKTLRSS